MQKIIETGFGKIEISTFGKQELSDIDFNSENASLLISKRLSELLNTSETNIYGLKQVHGIDFFLAEQSPQISTGDGLWTLNKDNILYVKTADCMPLFFWSTSRLLFGVLHSGWKGTRDGITQKMINALKTQYPDIQLNFYLGPCIRKNEYEVKEDVSIFFDKKALSFISNKIYLGLENAISFIIKENNYILEDCNISTLSHPDYFSHRGKDIGRNLNVIRFLN
jgi:polyphenol oxidase